MILLQKMKPIIIKTTQTTKQTNKIGDNGVDLYIVDSGVRETHEQFVNNDVIHMLGDGYAYYADSNYYGSHGTHVAGTAGGKDYGVSKNLTIYDYRVCEYPSDPDDSSDYPCYTNLLLSALQNITYKLMETNATRRGVINLSLGGTRSFFSYMYEYYFDLIIEFGGIPVVAAGNSYIDACGYAPAWSSFAITVGAADSNYEVECLNEFCIFFLFCFCFCFPYLQ